MLRKNIFSILIAIVILYLSLANSSEFDRVQINIPFADKLVHIAMYFTLSISIFIENRSRVLKKSSLFRLGLIPFVYGVLMEILQAFTATRSPDITDAIADAAGILIAVMLFILVKPLKAKF